MLGVPILTEETLPSDFTTTSNLLFPVKDKKSRPIGDLLFFLRTLFVHFPIELDGQRGDGSGEEAAEGLALADALADGRG